MAHMAHNAPRALAGAIVVALLLLGGCGFLGGTNGNTPPGGIGNVNGVPNSTVNVTASSFSPSSVSIRAEQSISFANHTGTPGGTSGGTAGGGSTPGTGVNPTSGTDSGSGPALTICMGQNGTCSLHKNGPTQLQWPPALALRGGQSTSVVFPSTGTYHVTIENQPNANLTVTATS
ncbi:MAG TPA: hypothetical protein VF120_07075 [Ktedonobacterales bacterium]